MPLLPVNPEGLCVPATSVSLDVTAAHECGSPNFPQERETEPPPLNIFPRDFFSRKPLGFFCI